MSRKTTFSIRKKLISLIVVLLALTIATLSSIEFFRERKIIQERTFSGLTALLDARKDLILGLLEMEISNANSISTRRLPRDYLIKEMSGDPAMNQAVVEGLKTLTDAKNSIKSIRSIDVLDIFGMTVLSTEKDSIGRDLKDTAFFNRALGGPYLSDIYFYEGFYLLDIAVPVYSPLAGETRKIGVCKITFVQNRLIEILGDYQGLGSTGEVVLAKLEGREMVFINPLRNLKVKDPAVKFSVPLESDKAQAMQLAVLQKKGIGVFRDYRGKQILAAYDYIPLTGWGIVAKIDLSETHRPVSTTLLIILATSIIIFFISSFAAVYASELISKPINELNAAVERISRGDFAARANVPGRDELSQLASAFNRMAERLLTITASRDELNREIEKRKIAEENLRQFHQRLTDIIEFLPDAVFVVDKNREVIAWNKAIEVMTGVNKANIIGKGDYEYSLSFYGERRPMLIDLVFEPLGSLKDKYQNITREGNKLYGETFASRAYQGKGAFLASIASPLFDAKGEMVGAIEAIRDFSARKKAEEERNSALSEALKTREIFASMLEDNNKIREELESRVKELNATYVELKDTQAQLVQTAKMAAMGQLVAGVSHELNQPLTGIKGYAQTASADLATLNVPDTLRQDLKKIIDQADRMAGIIENLRIFARRSEVKMENIDINVPLQSSVQLLGEQFRVHDIRLEVDLRQGLPLINGDSNQLQQIFLNLLTNARDAVESVRRENSKVSVQSRLSEDGTHIEVVFSDNGCGISASKIDQIFNPFYTTKDPNRGMGLGLSIAYSIAHSHSGSIEVSSEEGKGSTFKLILPVVS